MRLHQPHRSLQPSQHIHHSRSCSTWIPDLPLPYQRILAGLGPEPATAGMEHQEDCGQHSPAGCDRDLPETQRSQEGIIHKAGLPPHHVLLLPLQHDCRPDQGRGPPLGALRPLCSGHRAHNLTGMVTGRPSSHAEEWCGM